MQNPMNCVLTSSSKNIRQAQRTSTVMKYRIEYFRQLDVLQDESYSTRLQMISQTQSRTEIHPSQMIMRNKY